jgi:hypothetical protein
MQIYIISVESKTEKLPITLYESICWVLQNLQIIWTPEEYSLLENAM